MRYVNSHSSNYTPSYHITRVTRKCVTKHDIDIEEMNSNFYETTCSDKPPLWSLRPCEWRNLIVCIIFISYPDFMSNEWLVLQLPDDLNPRVEDVDLLPTDDQLPRTHFAFITVEKQLLQYVLSPLPLTWRIRIAVLVVLVRRRPNDLGTDIVGTAHGRQIKTIELILGK